MMAQTCPKSVICRLRVAVVLVVHTLMLVKPLWISSLTSSMSRSGTGTPHSGVDPSVPMPNSTVWKL